MVFASSDVTTRRGDSGAFHVSLAPETVLPKVRDIQNCISKNKLKRVSSELSTCQILALMMGLCIIALVSLCLVLLSSRSSECASSEPVVTTDVTPVLPRMINSVTLLRGHAEAKELRIVERDEWGAVPPAEPLPGLELPVPLVIVSYSAMDYCYTTWDCKSRVRDVQKFDMENQTQSDIGYNFMIGGNGFAYVGRGWDSIGPDTRAYHSKSIAISFIGDFSTVKPPERQILAAHRLIQLGVKSGKVDPGYKILGEQRSQLTNIVGED